MAKRWSDLPSPKQLERAAELGVEVPEGINSGQLSELLDSAPASSAQKAFARELGITREGLTAGEMHELLSIVLPEKNKEAIRRRGFAVGDVLQHGEKVLLITKVWSRTHGRLTVKTVTLDGNRIANVSRCATHTNAFTLKDAKKLIVSR